MLHAILTKLDHVLNFETAKAHCDIPCGIYDPILAQIAALTAIRMIDLVEDLEKTTEKKDVRYQNTVTRYILAKEEHAEKCKHEVRVLLGDYFTPVHMEKYPELSGLGFRIMKLASETRQSLNRSKALELLQNINRLAEIFWETKEIRTQKKRAPYKPGEELVYPALS